MKRIYLFVLVVSFASVCAQAESVIQRTVDGKCARFDVNTGAFFDIIEDFHCGGYKKVWSETGHCIEVNFAGKFVSSKPDHECGEDKYQRVLIRDYKPLFVLNSMQYGLFLSKGSLLGNFLTFAEHKALRIFPAFMTGLILNPQALFLEGDLVLCYRTSGGNRIKNPVHHSYCDLNA